MGVSGCEWGRVVFKDADLDRSSFINQGEVCLTTSRIYVQQEIYQNFLDRFVKMTKKELRL